jgi:hypothetical protein
MPRLPNRGIFQIEFGQLLLNFAQGAVLVKFKRRRVR